MNHWNAGTWLGVIGGGLTLVGIVLSYVFWWRPRPTPTRRLEAHERLAVEVANHFFVFDHGVGDQLVAVIARNGSDRRVRATGYGIALPTNRHLVLQARLTPLDPQLPHWIEPGDAATWYFAAADLRTAAREEGVTFDVMRAYVTFADGRKVTADRGLPV